jgi:uncharacterized protein (TIGR02596 family)
MHARPGPLSRANPRGNSPKLEVAMRRMRAMNVITLPSTTFRLMKTSPPRNRGFSLLELIVVILIIGIIAAFAVPATSTILRGSQLTQSSQIIVDQISLARQHALTKNHPVEVRFIRYVDPEVPDDRGPDGLPGAFRAIQVFDVLDNGQMVPIDKPQLLSQSIVISGEVNFSTLIAHSDITKVTKAQVKQDKSAPKLPRKIEDNYEYVSFRYLPDGSTNLNATSGTVWFVTIHNLNDRPTGSTPPPNFFTLQIDPVSGTARNYRPSL